LFKIYHIDGFEIKVYLKFQSVHLVANYALRRCARKRVANMDRLCRQVLDDYRSFYGKDLKIKIDSLVTEVLGHVYAYEILLFLRKLLPLGLLKWLSLRACGIDCGEKKRDANRWIWDWCGKVRAFLSRFAK